MSLSRQSYWTITQSTDPPFFRLCGPTFFSTALPSAAGVAGGCLVRSSSRCSDAICEHSMEFCHHDSSLTDCRAHPLDRARPHVANRKHARNACFQWHQSARSIAHRGGIRWNVRARQYEILVIQGDPAVLEPDRRWIGTNEQE